MKAELINKLQALIAHYEADETPEDGDDYTPDDDYAEAFSVGGVDACEQILVWLESLAEQPAPAFPKVRILLDDDGYAAATTSIEMDVVFLDCNIPLEDKGKAFKKAAKAFYDQYNQLPHQYRP